MEMPKWTKKLIKKLVFHVFAKRFIAGETVEDVIRVVRKLNKSGFYAIINILGEHITDSKEVLRIRNQYIKLIGRLAKAGLPKCHISVKPSQLGLDISKEFYIENMVAILRKAKRYLPDALVETDRELPEQAAVVREIILELFKSYPNQRLAGQINQRYVFEEIKEIIRVGLPYRLTTGTAYLSDRNLDDEEKIKEIFCEQGLLLAKNGKRCVAATHNLWSLERLAGVMGIQVLLGIENYEHEPWYWKYPLKFLYWITGMKNNEAIKLVQQGVEVGVYVAYGPDWESFSKRRWTAVPKIFWRNWGYRIKK